MRILRRIVNRPEEAECEMRILDRYAVFRMFMMDTEKNIE